MNEYMKNQTKNQCCMRCEPSHNAIGSPSDLNCPCFCHSQDSKCEHVISCSHCHKCLACECKCRRVSGIPMREINATENVQSWEREFCKRFFVYEMKEGNKFPDHVGAEKEAIKFISTEIQRAVEAERNKTI